MEHYQIRKTSAQKAAFRNWLIEALTKAGYSPEVESSGSFNQSHNIVAGNPESAKIVFTAHYDTCAVLPFPNLITPRNLFLFLLYQLLLVLPMFVLAAGAEILLLFCWDDCPMWLAMLVVYAVLGACIWWITNGPANKHTANDNTSGVATLLEIALALPDEQRDQIAFVFFDNEEKGLLGSAQFKKLHGKNLDNTLLVNFDCVSDGDHIQFFPNKTLKQNERILLALEESYLPEGCKKVEVVRGFGFYPSDQRAFPLGVGVAALHKGRIGYWLGRIHTGRDTVFESKNIELLRDGSLALISLLSD